MFYEMAKCHKRLGLALIVSLCTSPIAFPQQTITGNGAAGVPGGACSDAASETALRQREIALLGPDHAAAHANAPLHKCRVAMGLENVASASPAVLASALAQPATAVGRWSNPFTIPVVGIASVLLNNGKVLFWSYNPPDYLNPSASNTGVAYVWDPATRTGHSITSPENIWCGGQTILSDGRVYVAGGNLRYPDPNAAPGQTGWEGSLSNYTFNPKTEKWTRQPDMSVGRWYPTVTQPSDNSVVITSGYDQTGTVDQNGSQAGAITQAVELFRPSSAINGIGSISAISTHDPTGLYPYQYLTASGQMLQAGPSLNNSYLLAPGTWSWSPVPNLITSHYGYGNGIIFTDVSVTPISQIVTIAGGENGQTTLSNNEWLDTNNLGAGWRPYPQWLQTRHNANTVILPDGTLFTVGGNQDPTTYGTPLFESELYSKSANDPTGQWVQMAPNAIQAAYHSSAILLPDATVLLSQDDMSPGAASSHQAQVFSPPYLFKGTQPQIKKAPPSASRGQTISVSVNTPNISGVALVAPGAVTHANDMHQRYIKLKPMGSGRNIQVAIPASANLVPPRYYMLFVIDGNGIPSRAQFIRITRGQQRIIAYLSVWFCRPFLSNKGIGVTFNTTKFRMETSLWDEKSGRYST